MKILSLAPQHNVKGKVDATGAFQPEARAFAALHGAPSPVLIDNRQNKAVMRQHVLSAIAAAQPDVLALFCHGWSSGIQFGFGTAHVGALAAAMPPAAEVVGTIPRIIIYGCLTADGGGAGGDSGFADALRDAMCRVGHVHVQVDAHVTAGHCCRNPFVRRFDGNGLAEGGVGGYYLVAPKSAAWARWIAALKGDLRFRFPFLGVVDLHRELGA